MSGIIYHKNVLFYSYCHTDGAEDVEEVTLETFRQLMHRLEEQKQQMESLDEKTDVGVVRINIARLKERMLPSPTSCLTRLHIMLPKLAAGEIWVPDNHLFVWVALMLSHP